MSRLKFEFCGFLGFPINSKAEASGVRCLDIRRLAVSLIYWNR